MLDLVEKYKNYMEIEYKDDKNKVNNNWSFR